MGHTINSSESKYNGWTNYATWRINLEIFDGYDLREPFPDDDVLPLPHEVAEWAKAYAENIIDEEGTRSGLAVDYALAFLADVNWHEIAEHLIDYTNDCARADAA